MHAAFLVLLTSALAAFASPSPALSARASTCTLSAAGPGKDDAPAFLSAVRTCDTAVVPHGTTLNISTPLNMTGVNNKHIVRTTLVPTLDPGC
jgi:galacturan 1,4-alpha-galacturonidase